MELYPLTVFYAQIIGVILFISSLALLLNPGLIKEMLKEAKLSKSLIYIDASFSLFFGTLLILTHNVWNSLFESLVSAFGWLLFVIGTLEMLLPHKVLLNIYNKCAKHAVFAVAMLFVLSVVLIVVSFGFVKPF